MPPELLHISFETLLRFQLTARIYGSSRATEVHSPKCWRLGQFALTNSRRAKISHDPNNTAWTRSESRFGKKLLLSQGWTPGSSLGAGNPSSTNNPDSISHVRVTVKDDNRGLGARNGFFDEDRPTTGLDGLQDLLGRLNGKDNQLLQVEQRKRADSTLAIYAERRWGFENFVSGGFLVGDRLQRPEGVLANVSSRKPDVTISRPSRTKDEDLAGVERKKRRPTPEAMGTGSSGANAMDRQRSKNSQPEFVEIFRDLEEAEPSIVTDSNRPETERRIRKSERKRRSRKAEKSAARALKKSRQELHPMASSIDAQEAKAATTQVPRTTRAYARHAVRQRSLRHKKMSLTDQKALNEVCGFTNSLFPVLTCVIDSDDTCAVILPQGSAI